MMGNKRRLGQHPSEETRAKLSAARMGNKNRLGKPHSATTRARMSAAGMGHQNSFGYRHSAGARERISKSLMGNKRSLGHHPSKETLAKLRSLRPSTETRERISAARSRQKFPFNDTLPERLVCDWLAARGVTFKKQGSIPGVKAHRFDFLVVDHKVAVEADGCYWHGCPQHCPGKSAKQRDRDVENDHRASGAGWSVVRLWEHDILQGNFGALEVALGLNAPSAPGKAA